ncbi:hypothetical protein NL676_005321 [Syzygium grande]|nr:hypothetical protein NL676_005321 [Syzygium grande]
MVRGSNNGCLRRSSLGVMLPVIRSHRRSQERKEGLEPGGDGDDHGGGCRCSQLLFEYKNLSKKMRGDRKNIPWFKTFFSFLASPGRADHRKYHTKRTAPEAAIVAASKHFSAPHKVRFG